MAAARQMSVESSAELRRAGVLEIVEYVGAWYDGSRRRIPLARASEIPLGARMIAIVEAFDAMTTDHVYRPAMSLERRDDRAVRVRRHAVRPGAGAELRRVSPRRTSRRCGARWPRGWLRALDPELVNSYWQLNCVALGAAHAAMRGAFPGQASWTTCTTRWSSSTPACSHRLEPRRRAAHRHHRPNSIRQQQWQPELLSMHEREGAAGQRRRLPGALRDPLGRAVAAAADDLRPQRPAGGGRQRTRFPWRPTTAHARARSCCCTTPRRRPRWSSAARPSTTRRPRTR